MGLTQFAGIGPDCGIDLVFFFFNWPCLWELSSLFKIYVVRIISLVIPYLKVNKHNRQKLNLRISQNCPL